MPVSETNVLALHREVPQQSDAATLRDIERLGPWFHNLHLPDGTMTCPGHVLGDFPSFKWREIEPSIPRDLRGWRVLDVGCNAGFYSFELAKRGAQVLGIDIEPLFLDQARWAAVRLGLQDRVTFQRLQIYDLARVSGQFDLVLFLGVFYHLRYPLLGLDIVSRKVLRMLVFQSMAMPGCDVESDTANPTLGERFKLQRQGWPKMAFIENELQGDRTNWWVPNHAAIEAMLRSSGLRVTERPHDEVYVCAPEPASSSSHWGWNADEYTAATGVEGIGT